MKKKYNVIFGLILIIFIGLSIILWIFFGNFGISSYNYSIKNAFPNLSFSNPVGLYHPNDGTDRLFVIQQDGLIYTFQNNESTNTKNLFLDLSDDISTGGERGLLGLAFHPNFTSNGYFFVDYTDEGTGNTIISRFKVNETNLNLANKSSEYTFLEVTQPYSNHNGGQIQFGSDAYLYISLGDGGGVGDPDQNGQNRMTQLGAILRIDVDSGSPYSIPTDNPFYGNVNGWAEEIFAFGFRNPWRFSFDSLTGDLWAGDVGQNSWEEIDIVEKGKNYGWNTKEGFHDYVGGVNNVTPVEPPIFEYGHDIGISITGGYVYRGSSLTDLIGKYIYADYGTGKIWSLEYSDGVVIENKLLYDAIISIPSFGVDANNELYICAFDGKIYTLVQT
ncbi:MAG: glucose sorbosone dehydrogenase [Promethearchaeota archaeon]|nr:MAG: glucose sorbosone dehydrogenase [Candidatus Lokiarchaeota archaeon]